jgi:DNA-binding CsgD family transcriptional regulator
MPDYGGYYGDEVHSEREPLDATARELEVLRYTSYGLKWRECADAMGIAPDTVMAHLSHVRRKLRAKNTAHAVAIALRLGLID